ncbi:MAG: hypothetical protein PHH69_05765 [Candidatus Omnitrophica bacterium]|nr:hypothetical protein [Candidatus Omnitrophota bacterium]
MQIKRKVILILLVSLLAGCATQGKYQKKLDTWIDHDMEELISSWGYPDSSFTAPNGNTVYVYTSASSVTTPSQTTYYGQVNPGGTYSGSSLTSGGQQVNFSCKTFFEVNAEKKITRWSYEGNGCTSR